MIIWLKPLSSTGSKLKEAEIALLSLWPLYPAWCLLGSTKTQKKDLLNEWEKMFKWRSKTIIGQ